MRRISTANHAKHANIFQRKNFDTNFTNSRELKRAASPKENSPGQAARRPGLIVKKIPSPVRATEITFA
jgi:hypothetical protein